MKRTILKILAVVFLSAVLIVGLSGSAFAEGYIIDSDKNGLEIHVPEKTKDTGNLNPGDAMYSCLKIVNTGKKTLTVYIRTNILSEKSPLGEQAADVMSFILSAPPLTGGKLADVMALTIKDGGKVVAQDTFRNVAAEGNILLGDMAPGAEKEICFFSDFSGGTGNEYQGASLKVNWSFTTQATGGGGGGTGGGEFYWGREAEPLEELEIETEPPGVEPFPEVEMEIKPEPPGQMPKTGVDIPYLYYLLGGLTLFTGIRLARKPKRRE